MKTSVVRGLIPLLFVLALSSGPAFGDPSVIVSKVSNGDPEGVRAGEGAVVALPQDPNTIVTIWLGTSAAGNPGDPSPGTGGTGYCGIGRSTDGGLTWSIRKAPYQGNTIPGTVPICGDPQGEVLRTGAIVFTGVQLGSPTEFMQSITSFDGGQTWSPPSAPFGPRPALASALANQTVPDLGPGRQFTAADPITGELHIQSQVDVATTGRQLTVSTDQGFHWSTPRNTGTTGLGPIGAAFGVVAGVYSSGGTAIFETTTDHGATWVRNPMPTSPGSGFGGPITAADPTARSRFAVLISRGSTLEVWITTDAGRTAANWTQAKVIAAEPGDTLDHPWIAYSRTGAIGIRWRAKNPDGSYDIDAVVSRDGGTTWGNRVRLTAARGSSPAQDGLPLPGDDCACNLHLTANRLLTVWGDMSSGYRELWFGSFDYTTP